MSKRIPALWLAFSAGLILRVLLPWYAHGFRQMDEHWQVIEPASSFLGRDWSRTVEWQEGLRSWIFPWLVSLPMRFAEKIGIREPLWIVAFTRSVFGMLSSLAVPLSYLGVLACAPRGSRADAWAIRAAWFVALWPFSVFCGFHLHGEMVGALFVLTGSLVPLLLRSETTAYLLSGLSFGIALALKIDVAVAGLGFGIWQLIHLRLRRALSLAMGVAIPVFTVGLVDRLTWGHWFQNVLGHAHANLVEGVGNQWGVSPWYTHVLYYFDITSALALLALLPMAKRWRELPDGLKAILFMNFFFVAVFCFIPHKEKRFLAPLLYTGIVSSFAALAVADKIRAATITALAATAAHFAVNANVYLIQRPWWDRVSAIVNAGKIPGIEKMINPHWPALFYFPRKVPAALSGALDWQLREATKDLKSFGLATDWKTFPTFESMGFKCEPWPEPAPASPDPVPWAYRCSRP